LRARLGIEAVHGLEVFADHRPERAYRRTLPGEAADSSGGLKRPLWLLPQPRRLQAGENLAATERPLVLLDGPERVESGWWDDFDVKRDYFVACDSAGSKLWLYRERPDGENWFVHGIFA
jgi:protein ImuB